MKGHWEGGGYQWKKRPKCWMCERSAVYVTEHVTLCDDPQCHIAYAEQGYDKIEFVENEEENSG